MSQPHIILLAHGSRDTRWCNVFEQGLERINTNLDHDASLCYLEMAAPSLEQMVTELYNNGKNNLVIFPMFLAAGRHLLHDVPETMHLLKKKCAGLEIELHEAMGHKDEFWDFMAILLAGEITKLSA